MRVAYNPTFWWPVVQKCRHVQELENYTLEMTLAEWCLKPRAGLEENAESFLALCLGCRFERAGSTQSPRAQGNVPHGQWLREALQLQPGKQKQYPPSRRSSPRM